MKHLKIWLALACAFGSCAALADAQTEFSVDQYLQRMTQEIGRAAR